MWTQHTHKYKNKKNTKGLKKEALCDKIITI